ncbi:MAG TPA: AlkA N-terminal domain-containing protein [Caulobacteraceae bacterium]|nr:AlkA N-terminal domain-containing protein [Caulobacteraceae bacterium]
MSENRETLTARAPIFPLMDLDHDACYRAIQTRDARFDGRLFTGVKTTGIYCRPVCPARTPKRENVNFYPTAAAAQEAGFRPCLRCRPETSPDLGAWRGSSNTVSRALRLIEAGALDAADVDALAGRLGVGERQLRRLFKVHLGASPIAVAQTRRVLLAKQLIHETLLPMVQVAMAAGFGSVRRFNETFQQLYDRPPRALRRSSAPDEPTAGAVTLKLAYRAPYDWQAMLAFLAARAIPGVEVVRDGVYARAIELDGVRGALRVAPAVGESRLAVAINFPRLDLLPAIIARLRRVFDLAADPLTIGAHLAEDPELAPLVAARPGLRVPGAWDGFEMAVRAVLGQQITVSAAIALAGRVAREYGGPIPEPLPGFESIAHAFPSAERLAGVDLSGLPMPRARSKALEALAAAAAADPDLFGPRGDLETAITRLTALPGIGEWTAQYIAMRQLREPDAFPAADIGLMRAMASADGVRPDARALLARAERWRPWRAYAAQHLWAADPAAAKPTKEPSDARQQAA